MLYFDVLGSDNDDAHGAVFIPEKDILSHSKGLLALNTKRSIPFDKTYIDLLSSAELGRIREIPTYMIDLMKKLAQVTGGEVVYQNDLFYMKKANGSLSRFPMKHLGLNALDCCGSSFRMDKSRVEMFYFGMNRITV